MKPFEDLLAETRAETQVEVETKFRADFPNQRKRAEDETDEEYRAREDGWFAKQRFEVMKEVNVAVIPKMEAKLKAIAESNRVQTRATEAKRVEAEAEVAKLARAYAEKVAVQGVLTDAEARGVPIARSAGAVAIYAQAGFEYVDATDPVHPVLVSA